MRIVVSWSTESRSWSWFLIRLFSVLCWMDVLKPASSPDEIRCPRESNQVNSSTLVLAGPQFRLICVLVGFSVVTVINRCFWVGSKSSRTLKENRCFSALFLQLLSRLSVYSSSSRVCVLAETASTGHTHTHTLLTEPHLLLCRWRWAWPDLSMSRCSIFPL